MNFKQTDRFFPTKAPHTSRPQPTNGSGPVARRDPAAQAGPSRWNLVEPAGSKLPFETRCPARVSIKTYKKENRSFRNGFLSGFQPQESLAAHSFIRAQRGNKDSDLRALGGAFLLFLVDSGMRRNQKGIPRSAERVSGLCPENPRPFEKGRRKLPLGLRCFFSKKRPSPKGRSLKNHLCD